jgi:hypothetical protein
MTVISILKVIQIRGSRELVLGVLAVLMTQVANAQFVRVGPAGGVRVRAPFVAVDVLPFGGGTRLRAPFTAVDTGFYRSYRFAPAPLVIGAIPVLVPYPYATIAVPAYPGFVYPPEYLSYYPEVVYPETGIPPRIGPGGVYRSARPGVIPPLPERLRDAAERLARTLSLREDGDVWLNYLGPQRIIENVDYSWSPETVHDLIINYDGVVTNGRLGSIQYARGFAETRDLLRQYLQTPEAIPSAPSTSSGASSGQRSPAPPLNAPPLNAPPLNAPSPNAQPPNAQPPIPNRSVPRPPPAKPPAGAPSLGNQSDNGGVNGPALDADAAEILSPGPPEAVTAAEHDASVRKAAKEVTPISL